LDVVVVVGEFEFEVVECECFGQVFVLFDYCYGVDHVGVQVEVV